MRYYAPRDLRKIIKMLNPNEFLQYMKQVGELEEITDNYSYDCCLLCENAVAWMLKKLCETVYFYSINVCYGRYSIMPHYWLRIGDYNIDLTLKQFVKDAPELAITLIEEAKEYQVYHETSAEQYISKLKQEAQC